MSAQPTVYTSVAPDQHTPSSSPVWIATSISSHGRVTGTTPNFVRKRPPVGKVKTRSPCRSCRLRIGLVVAKLQGSQDPALSQVTPGISLYASSQISFSPYQLNKAGTSRL